MKQPTTPINLPPSFDPLSVTEIGLNSCYFAEDVDDETVEKLVAEKFPNATVCWYLFHEDLSTGVGYVSPPPSDREDSDRVCAALEDFLPQGPHRGNGRMNEGNYIDGKYVGPEPPSAKETPQISPTEGEAWKRES